jgi:hypothetical protein
MTKIVICLVALAVLTTVTPASARVIERDIVVHDGWRPWAPWHRHAWDPAWRAECRVIVERRIRPAGTRVVRRIPPLRLKRGSVAALVVATTRAMMASRVEMVG